MLPILIEDLDCDSGSEECEQLRERLDMIARYL